MLEDRLFGNSRLKGTTKCRATTALLLLLLLLICFAFPADAAVVPPKQQGQTSSRLEVYVNENSINYNGRQTERLSRIFAQGHINEGRKEGRKDRGMQSVGEPIIWVTIIA